MGRMVKPLHLVETLNIQVQELRAVSRIRTKRTRSFCTQY